MFNDILKNFNNKIIKIKKLNKLKKILKLGKTFYKLINEVWLAI